MLLSDTHLNTIHRWDCHWPDGPRRLSNDGHSEEYWGLITQSITQSGTIMIFFLFLDRLWFLLPGLCWEGSPTFTWSRGSQGFHFHLVHFHFHLVHFHLVHFHLLHFHLVILFTFTWSLSLRPEAHKVQGVFFNWYPPKKLKYGKPRLGVSMLT